MGGMWICGYNFSFKEFMILSLKDFFAAYSFPIFMWIFMVVERSQLVPATSLE